MRTLLKPVKALGRLVARVWESGRLGKAFLGLLALGAVISGNVGTEPPEPEPVAVATAEAPAPEPAKPEPEPVSEEPERDLVAESACRHYVNTVDDITRGVLSEEEVRVKLREIHESARYADDRKVARGAEGLLAAWTHGTGGDIETAAESLGTACMPHL